MIDVVTKLLAHCARRQAMAMSQQVQRVPGCAATSQSHVGIGPVSFLILVLMLNKNQFQKMKPGLFREFPTCDWDIILGVSCFGYGIE